MTPLEEEVLELSDRVDDLEAELAQLKLDRQALEESVVNVVEIITRFVNTPKVRAVLGEMTVQLPANPGV